MIVAELFADKNGVLTGFHISGHSMYDEAGKDIVCAFVSSAAYMAANTITDVIRANAKASARDGDMRVLVSPEDAHKCRDILEGLRLHLKNTQEQYPDYLQLILTEV